jgi:TonB family protein
MPNQPRNNRWYRIAPSVLISAAINAAIIIALSVVVNSPKNDIAEYQVNYDNQVKNINKAEIKKKPVVKKSKSVVKNTAVKPVARPANKKIAVVKPVKKTAVTAKKVIIVKTVTPAPIKDTPENTDKKNTARPNPAAIAKVNPASSHNNNLPDNNPGGGGSSGGRNNSLANDNPNNPTGNNGNNGRPGRIGPGNMPGRPGPGDGDDGPGYGEPTFGTPLEPGYGKPGGNGPGDGNGKYPGTGGDGPGGNGTGDGMGPGKYRGGDGDGPGKGGWGGDGSGEPRNLKMADGGDKPGEKSKTGSAANPGVKMNPDSGTPGYSRKARAIKLTAPEYPSVARRRGQEGDVYVRVDISEEGKPIGKPVVVISSDVYQLDQSAIEYVQNTDFIQYVPAIKGGKPAKDSVVVQVTFKLNGER